MTTKGCERVIDQVSAILDGEASPLARLRFTAHLLVCPSCRRYVDQLKAVKDAAGVVTEEDMPEDFGSVMGFVLDAISEECTEG